MPKVTTILVMGGAGTVLAAGGAYMLGFFGGGDEMTLPQDLESFKKDGNKYCVSSYFSELSLRGDISAKSAKLEHSFFPTSTDPKPTQKSCLLINWDREKYSEDDKWEGNFRWLWSFVQGDNGFVMFTSANAKKTSAQLNLTGGIYFVKKKSGTSNSGEVEKYQEMPTGNGQKQIPKADFDTKFPSVGEGITEKDKFGENKEHWGFVSGNADLDKICTDADADKCKAEKSKEKDWFRGRWEGESSGTPQKKITDWGKNGNTWFSNMYGTDAVDFSTFFDNIQGKWINQKLSGSKITP